MVLFRVGKQLKHAVSGPLPIMVWETRAEPAELRMDTSDQSLGHELHLSKTSPFCSLVEIQNPAQSRDPEDNPPTHTFSTEWLTA
jgi:hypothetical protein